MIIIHKMKAEGLDVIYDCDVFSVQADDHSCVNQSGDYIPSHKIVAFKTIDDQRQVQLTKRPFDIVAPSDELFHLIDGVLVQINKPERRAN